MVVNRATTGECGPVGSAESSSLDLNLNRRMSVVGGMLVAANNSCRDANRAAWEQRFVAANNNGEDMREAV